MTCQRRNQTLSFWTDNTTEMNQPFREVIDFLQHYEWIYNFKLTDFFTNQVWENIPYEWVPCLLSLSIEELNGIPYGHLKDSWPQSFKDFLLKAISFSLGRSHSNNMDEPDLDLDQDLKKGMNTKKQHEVKQMSTLVHDLAGKTGSDVIVDVGSGLGYLGQTINRKFGHRVIGIEGKSSHTSSADRRIPYTGGVTNITCELVSTTESMDNFHYLITEMFTSEDDKVITPFCECCNTSSSGSHGSAVEREATVVKDFDRNSCSNLEHKTDPNKHNIFSEQLVSFNGCHGNHRTNLNDSYCKNCIQLHKIRGFHDNIKIDQKVYCTRESANLPIFKGCHTKEECCHKRDQKEQRKTQNCGDCEQLWLTCKHDKMEENTLCTSPVIPNIVMIGLHCCGDLTPTMMRYFTSLEYVRGLCCVSCCYHRMRWNASSGQFDSFPMSSAVKAILDAKQNWNLNLFGMRLGAQETRARWKTQSMEDHQFHMKNVAYRAILEVFSKQEQCDSKKLFRKLTRQGDMSDFTVYIEAVVKRTKLGANDLNLDIVKEKLQELFCKFEKYFSYIEPFTALQVVLQPVIETLITRDRQAWLTEQGYNASIVPIFDDSISPRNLGLVVLKQ